MINNTQPAKDAAAAPACARCGFCCIYLSFIFENTPGVQEWLKARGFKVMQESDKAVEAVITNPCTQYDGTGCRIQDHKPAACKEFPALASEKRKKYYADRGLDVRLSVPAECGYLKT